MAPYDAPITELNFVLNDLVGLGDIAALPGNEAASAEIVAAALEEAGRLAREVLDPINRAGDQAGCVVGNGEVRTPAGFKEAYAQYVAGGWNGVPFDPEFGGQGLPWTVAMALHEIWHSANLSFALGPLLTQAAVEAIVAHGSTEQQAAYLPKLVSGEWMGTMNLTEPQAGTDLGVIRCKAVRDGDHYRLSGQKIFISYGEHDLSENIIHIVLARIADAPAGVKGLSVFIVPKFLVESDGSIGARNDVHCVSLEHKLGIHASPTAVMAYGESEGAVAYLLGEENRGIECMFTMMNLARLGVGLQGVAIAERAYQQARDYAKDRIQGNAADGTPQAIIGYPDVRRMLMSMRAGVEAIRALVYFVAANTDRANGHPDAERRAECQEIVDLLTPVAKAWSTDLAFEIASTGVQVHGGMGFIEETGAAQYLRDARITMIYEGTNGIQANDLLGRKLFRDQGRAAKAFIAAMRALDKPLAGAAGDDIAAIREGLADGVAALSAATDWMLQHSAEHTDETLAGAVPYLRLFGTVTGGYLMARAALVATRKIAADTDSAFHPAKLTTARFFAEHYLPGAAALVPVISAGGGTVMALGEEAF